jgi:LytS/YehU family sensor histidine kinase
MLYESDEDKVLIENEVQYISDYIDLQGIRFGESVVVEKKIAIEGLNDRFIEPMLLIPFIENAFKHGTSVLKNPEIHISIEEKQGALLLEVKNKFVTTIRDNKNNGIGLTNVGRRLELLYPTKHTLNQSIEKDWYSVFLAIDLTK